MCDERPLPFICPPFVYQLLHNLLVKTSWYEIMATFQALESQSFERSNPKTGLVEQIPALVSLYEDDLSLSLSLSAGMRVILRVCVLL